MEPDRNMLKCAVKNCRSKYMFDKAIFYFKLPENILLRNEWVSACSLINHVNQQALRICSLHFRNSDYIDKCDSKALNSRYYPKLKENAVPHLNMSKREHSNRVQKREIRRYLLDTQRRIAVKTELDIFFDVHNARSFSCVYGTPFLSKFRNENLVRVCKLEKKIRKLKKQKAKLKFAYRYWREMCSAKTEILKKLFFKKQKMCYSLMQQQHNV
ncbi:hypothetical protein X975_02016, partial [Stegodyphus mimosarum]